MRHEIISSGFAEGLGETSAWVADTMDTLGLQDRGAAVTMLRVGLHAVRDSVAAEDVVDLAAALPRPLRDVFFEGWDPAGQRPLQFDELVGLLGRRCGGGPEGAARARGLIHLLGRRLLCAAPAAVEPSSASLDAMLGRAAA